jgi:hypothetical protein
LKIKRSARKTIALTREESNSHADDIVNSLHQPTTTKQTATATISSKDQFNQAVSFTESCVYDNASNGGKDMSTTGFLPTILPTSTLDTSLGTQN